jgi:hypothetical protein
VLLERVLLLAAAFVEVLRVTASVVVEIPGEPAGCVVLARPEAVTLRSDPMLSATGAGTATPAGPGGGGRRR